MFAVGCRGSSANKAGGPHAKSTLVLTMADWSDGDGLEAFANQVERLSGGTMRIVAKTKWRHGQSRSENGLIGDISAGKPTSARPAAAPGTRWASTVFARF